MNKKNDMVCLTTLKSQTFNFTWVIDDIVAQFKLFKTEKLSSDPFTFINTTWQMCLSVDNRNENATLFVKLLQCDGKYGTKIKIMVNEVDENNQPKQSDYWIGETSKGMNLTFDLEQGGIYCDGVHCDNSDYDDDEYNDYNNERFQRKSVTTYKVKRLSNFIEREGQLRLLCTITMYGTTVTTNNEPTIKQELSNKVIHDIAALLTNNKLKDCVLSVEGKDIWAHQLILSARSPVLSVLLEKCEQSDLKKKLTIEGIKYETMLEVLSFMYTGKSDKIETMSKVLLEAADKFDMPDLKSKCQDYLISIINAENVCDLFICGDLSNALVLKNGAKKFISDNFAKVKSTTRFLDMANHHPHLIIEFIKDLTLTSLS